MIESELGEIPIGWRVEVLSNYCTKITKGTTPDKMFAYKSNKAFIKYVKGESLNKNHSFDIDKLSFIDSNTHDELYRSKLEEFDICYSIAGTLDKYAIVDKYILPANTNQAIAIIRVDRSKINLFYIIGIFISNWQLDYYKFNVQQAVQANLSLETISSLPIIIPDKITIHHISRYIEVVFRYKLNIDLQSRELNKLKELLLSKLTKIGE